MNLRKLYSWTTRAMLFIVLALSLIACNVVLPQVPTPTPTRQFTGATQVPTAPVIIQNSEELYGDNIADGQSNATAASLPVDSALPPLQSGNLSETGAQAIQIFLADGASVTGTLHEPLERAGRVAGVLIVSDTEQTWGNLPPTLRDAGYTVLLVDLPSAQLRAADMDVLLSSLSEMGSVDPGRIVAIGAGRTADMTLLGCAVYEICDAVVLLSPQSRDALLNVLPNFNPRPMLLITSLNDADSYATTSALAGRFAEGSRLIEQSTGRGTSLLSLNSNLDDTIAQWLAGVWGT
ncbi:MAG: hypothetical protein ACFE0Q_15985 [Anaerolineae bacterium]